MPQTEELDRLLSRVASGSLQALGELYDQVGRDVYVYALGLCGDVHLAADLRQEAFVRVWRAAARYRPCGKPLAWLFTLTRNLFRDWKRRQGRETLGVLPEQGQETGDRTALLAIQALDPAERQVALLHLVLDYSLEETAQRLRQPLAQVRWRSRRALAKLREALREDGEA